jgi:deoxyribonuclease V
MHQWNVSPREAIALQHELQSAVRITALSRPPKTIAGCDISLNMFEKDAYAGIVLMSYPDLQPITHVVVKSRVAFPYIPGLLSFREIPALLECVAKLPFLPDVLMVDGQGIAHPRRLGIASHLGILTNLPTIGCAKSLLYGTMTEPREPGDTAPITDPKTGDTIGVALKSKRNSNPLIISPGHLVTLDESVVIVKNCLRGYRIPEPTRMAHNVVNAFRRGEITV